MSKLAFMRENERGARPQAHPIDITQRSVGCSRESRKIALIWSGYYCLPGLIDMHVHLSDLTKPQVEQFRQP